MDNQDIVDNTYSAPKPSATPKESLKIEILLLTVLVVIALLPFVVVGTLYITKKPVLSNKIEHAFNKSALTGHILYADKTKVMLLDPKTGQVTPVTTIGTFGWRYQNGYIFSASQSAITRYSLANHQTDSYVSNALGAPQLYPSPDGKKIAVYDAPGYPGSPSAVDFFVYDFSKKTKIVLPVHTSRPQWFPDSEHILLSGPSSEKGVTLSDGSSLPASTLLVFDIPIQKSTTFAQGAISSVAISDAGDRVLWVDNTIASSSAKQLFPKPQPSVYQALFNPLLDAFFTPNISTAENLPTMIQDYKSVDQVITGQNTNYFVQVTGTTMGVYAIQDGKIKRISPAGAFWYHLISYNPNLDKVLAYKYMPASSANKDKIPPAEVVLLDTENEHETVVARVSSRVPSASYVFSPDNTLLIGPTAATNAQDTHYKIVAIADPHMSLSLPQNLGHDFYWVR